MIAVHNTGNEVYRNHGYYVKFFLTHPMRIATKFSMQLSKVTQYTF